MKEKKRMKGRKQASKEEKANKLALVTTNTKSMSRQGRDFCYL